MFLNSTKIQRVNLVLITASVLTLLFVLLISLHSQSVDAAPSSTTHAVCDTVQVISVSECEALITFYNATGGDNWTDNSGWLQSDTPCSDWVGIRCFSSQVIEINLPSQNLSGTLPAAITDLSGLRILDVSGNQLQGLVPGGLGTLAALETLWLTDNGFTGALTDISWGNFRQITDLRLDNNRFTGAIPPELGELEELQRLWLSGNDLSGSIPDTFGASCIDGAGGMCKLRELLLGGQQGELGGALPESLGNLFNLEKFDVVNNDIGGELPSSLLNLSKLTQFAASNNRLEGELPDFSAFPELTDLRLDGNAFTGTIPSSLGSLVNLERLWLSSNQLRGPVPAPVACLPNLNGDLTLAGNLLYVDNEAASRCLDALDMPGGYPELLGDQTVPPEDVRVGDITESYVELVWSPVYRANETAGWYQIAVTQSRNETPEFTIRTASKSVSSYKVRGLSPGTEYYLYIRTFTPEKGDQTYSQTSEISEPPLKARTPGVPPTFIFTKEVVPVQVEPGAFVTYTLTLSRTGGLAAVTVVDPLPPNTTFKEITHGNAVFRNDDIHFSGTLDVRAPMTIEYRLAVDATTQPGSILYSQATADQGNDEIFVASASVSVKAIEKVETLVLIYAGGDNNLSAHMQSLFQKAEAAAKPDGMVVLLLLDDIGEDGTYYYHLHNDLNQSEDCPNERNRSCNRYQEGVDMWSWSETIGTYTSLKEFVTSAILSYPADTVVLSLVGHGSGWSPHFLLDQPSTHDEKPDNRFFGGILWDKNAQSALSTAQLGLALDEVVATTGKTIDLLYLDACLMSMSEVVYEVGNAVDYLLASESISWTSFRYDLHLSWGTPPTDPVGIGRSWIENERTELAVESGIEYPYTYALLNLTNENAQELLRLENKLARTLIAGLSGDEAADTRERISDAVEETDCFDSNQDHIIDQNDYYCDLYSFVAQLETKFAEATGEINVHSYASTRREAIIEAARDLRLFLDPDEQRLTQYESNLATQHPHYPENPPWSWNKLGGISIYLPLRADDWKRRYYTASFLRSAADGYWDEFLDAYYAYTDAPRDDKPCTDCIPLGPESIVSQAAETEARIWLPLLASGVQ